MLRPGKTFKEDDLHTGICVFTSIISVAAALGFTTITALFHMADNNQPPVLRYVKKIAKELGLSSQQQVGIKAELRFCALHALCKAKKSNA